MLGDREAFVGGDREAEARHTFSARLTCHAAESSTYIRNRDFREQIPQPRPEEHPFALFPLAEAKTF
jgi:hypothetical protein